MEKIFDLHNDFYLKLNNDAKRNKYISNSEDYISKIVSAVWTSELSEEESFNQIKAAAIYTNAREKLFFGIEDLHFLSKDNLEKFLAFRPLYSGLTWNNTNCLAGGASESGKLTSFGKLVVKNLEKRNIFVDTAHLNEESFIDICKLSSKPILCSHTACYGMQAHQRNLKDYQIKMIVDSGGLFGLCLVSDFLDGSKHSNLDALVKHIDYFACKFGVNNLAIGSDFNGTKHLPKGINSYANLYFKLSERLIKLGYTEKSINKIFFDNANSFFLNNK